MTTEHIIEFWKYKASLREDFLDEYWETYEKQQNLNDVRFTN